MTSWGGSVGCERLNLHSAGHAATLAAAVRAMAPVPASVAPDVRAIVAGVRERGDAALREYAERFDHLAPHAPLEVTREELASALAGLDAPVRAGLEVAIANVREVAAAGLAPDAPVDLPQGQRVVLREIPVGRAGIYVPGGRHPYPSTVVMGVVTARAAGVDEVFVVAPGSHPVILAAAALCGADRVFRVGGAHAVAALAYGSASVPRVDVIAGPGGLHVQEAKRQVSGDVGIDGFYGPSDVVVVAGTGARAEHVALDLLAQAEHGPGTIVVAVSDDAALLGEVGDRVDAQWSSEAVAALVQAPDPDAALAFAEEFAPEHLELTGDAAEALAPRVRRAGCLFVGAQSAVAFGDYVAGSNHSLPTGGAARFASGLSVRAFRRRMAEVRIGPAADALAGAGVPVARAEGFTVHARSMQVRENG
jgi:histidinol dehydrogenase